MAIRGRKPLYEDPKALAEKVAEYFALCEARGDFPDLAGMRIYLRLTAAAMAAMQDEKNPNHAAYRAIFEEARDRRESFLVRRMAGMPKLAQGCLNALKQPDNGGYVDKAQDQGGKLEVTLKVAGLAGGTNSLK